VIFIKISSIEIKERRLKSEITQRKMASIIVSKFLKMIEIVVNQVKGVMMKQIKIKEFDKCRKSKMESDKNEYSK